MCCCLSPKVYRQEKPNTAKRKCHGQVRIELKTKEQFHLSMRILCPHYCEVSC